MGRVLAASSFLCTSLHVFMLVYLVPGGLYSFEKKCVRQAGEENVDRASISTAAKGSHAHAVFVLEVDHCGALGIYFPLWRTC